MYPQENEKTIKVLNWLKKSRANFAIWNILCGEESWYENTVGDCIDMIEETAEAELYPFALILISKLSKCQDMGEAIINIMINRINEADSDFGVITACINEFKCVAEQKGIMNSKIQL